MTSSSGWEFHNPVQVIFGAGRLDELSSRVSGRALVVTSAGAVRRGIASRVTDLVDDAALFDRVETNPAVDAVDDAVRMLRTETFETVVAIGGGSVLDVGKVLSLALAAPDFDLRSVIQGAARWQATEPLPLIAIPTTAGTGSEVTPTATLWDDRAKRKLSVGTPRLFPRVAIIDPELATSLPWEVTLSTGLDAYSQCFEAILNRNATPITTAFATRGIRLVPDGLRTLRRDAGDLAARTSMAEAALLSGLAISRTRTALAHSISYPLTAHLGVPHGLACAFGLPAVVEFHAEADDGSLDALGAGLGVGSAEAVTAVILALYHELDVPAVLRRHIGDVDALRPLVPEMLTPSRSDNSLRPATSADIDRLLDMTASWLSSVPSS